MPAKKLLRVSRCEGVKALEVELNRIEDEGGKRKEVVAVYVASYVEIYTIIWEEK